MQNITDNQMKRMRQNILFYLSIICIYASCTDPYPQTIIKVENIIKEHPDSALVILNSLKERKKESKSVRMYYDLLLTEARDRCYILHTSDSVMLSVTDYYEKEKDRDKLMKSYYYLGRVYLDLQDSPLALSYFHKALDVSVGTKDYAVLGRIYSQMGTLFIYEDITEEVLPSYRKAYQYFQLAKDSLASAYALRDLGRTFDLLEMRDSTIYYYKKAYELANNNGDKKKELAILEELANVYIFMGKYDEALAILQKTNNERQNVQEPNYGIWGEYFKRKGQKDSAVYYFKKNIGQINIYSDAGAYKSLYEIEKERHNYEKSLSFLEKFTECSDSIYTLSNTESLRKIKALYNYQHIVKQKEHLDKVNAEQRLWIICIITTCVLAIIIFIQYNINKKTAIQKQEKKLREIHEKQYRKSQKYIEENKSKIEKLKSRLELVQQEKDELHQELLLAQKERLEQTNQAIETSQREQVLLEEALRKSDIYTYCYQAIDDSSIILNEENWKKLEEVINDTYDNFTDRLFVLHPSITKIELHICMLLKIQIPISTISQLVCRTQSAVSMSRKQLYKKIFKKEGTPAKLDEFIITF